MDLIFLLAAFAGCGLLLSRMWPRKSFSSLIRDQDKLVSVIIPARNEEHNLPLLLASLKEVTHKNLEVIVVDDQSTDRTADVASEFGVKLISGSARPTGWNGKQWACQQGADAATGDYLLFTDADTRQFPEGVARAVSFMEQKNLEMMSTLPFHDCKSWWEKILGPFHILLLAITAPYARPQPGKVFVIGQFMMFSRAGYAHLGSHEVVKSKYVEDVPMANLALTKGMRYGVLHGEPLFSVRMYDKFSDFIKGWRRNFRAGLADSRKSAPLDVTLMICGMIGAGQFTNPLAWLPMLIVFSFLVWRQKQLGTFSILGPVLLPVALTVFCLVSILGAMDEALGRKLAWKDRQYAPQT